MDERERIAVLIAKYQDILLRMSIRITVYYITVAALVGLAAYFVPGFADQLPLGAPWLSGAMSLLYAMIATLLLMLPVSWVYRAIHTDSIYDHSIDTTTLVLPAVVAGIVTLVQHSLALAFSLAGIVAGVRFRRALSDTFDTLFILASIGVGIAAGVKSIEIAVVLTVFFNYAAIGAAIGVCAFGDGLESQHVVQRGIRRKKAKAEKNKVRPLPGGPTSSL